MRKLIFGILVLLALNACAQKRQYIFDNLSKVNKQNHKSYIPSEYQLNDDKQGNFLYSKGDSLFISVLFDEKGLVSVSTNDEVSSGIRGQVFETMLVKGFPLDILWLKGQVILRITEENGSRKYIFYDPERLSNKIKH